MAVTQDKKAEAPKDGKTKDNKKKEEEQEPELSEEDQELKKNLELMVERVQDADAGS